MPKHKKDEYPLFIRMTKKEREKLRMAQEARGFRTISEFVRDILHKEADNILKDTAA